MRGEYVDKMASTIAASYTRLELRIMEDIVRRIKQYGEITSTADWQIQRLRALGYSTEEIENEIKKRTGKSYPEMFELYDKVAADEYTRDRAAYEQINGEFIPYEENHQLQQAVAVIKAQTAAEFENITQSLGFYLDYNGRRVITPLAQVYGQILDDAMLGITSGAFDYNTALRRSVRQLTNSGLRVIDYPSGWHNRADVAARRAVMTGVTQITGHITQMNAAKLGTNYFEVAWHAGARPTHQAWQGKVYTAEELVTVCGLGTKTGLCGINCYHEYYPFFPGISERNWSDAWLKARNKRENTPKKWQGNKYTAYDAKQEQRRQETAMRAQREKVKLLKAGGADEQTVLNERMKYNVQLYQYAAFSNAMGLQQERERIYIDNRGRVAL